MINENRLNDLIIKTLKKEYPDIVDVEFGSKKVMLASSSEKHKIGDTLDVTIIKVTVDNIDKHLMFSGIKDMFSDIKTTLDSYFTLGIEEYGSLYDVELYVLEKTKKFG
jgi:hypothetical protein